MNICPLCESKDITIYCKNTDFLFEIAKEKFTLKKCLNCSLIFIDRSFTNEELSTFYPPNYWSSSSGKNGNNLENLYRKLVLLHHILYIKKFLKKGDFILDIGCGDGIFLNQLNKKNIYKAFGLEGFNKNVREENFKLISKKIEESLNLDLKFDVITAFHVLEHLKNPDTLLKKVKELLKPSGKFVFQIPNTNSIQAKIFKCNWTGIDIPRHLMNFNDKNIKILLDKFDLEIERVCYFSLRDSSPSIVCSIFPKLNPVYLNIKGKKGFIHFIKKILFLLLTILFEPFAFLEGILKKGGIIFVVVKNKERI